jgi:hypothetical protein
MFMQKNFGETLQNCRFELHGDSDFHLAVMPEGLKISVDDTPRFRPKAWIGW